MKIKILLFALLFSNNLFATNLLCTAKTYTFDIIVRKKTIDLSGHVFDVDLKLHIEDSAKPNITDDYLLVIGKEHNIAIPLKCVKTL